MTTPPEGRDPLYLQAGSASISTGGLTKMRAAGVSINPDLLGPAQTAQDGRGSAARAMARSEALSAAVVPLRAL